jgi:hypothetical protein
VAWPRRIQLVGVTSFHGASKEHEEPGTVRRAADERQMAAGSIASPANRASRA